MTNRQLHQYAKLTEFLGRTLGPDYEIILHDFTDLEHSTVAIANNQVSGREIGSPLTDIEQKLLEEQINEGPDYILHYRGISNGGKVLRTSTFFIREGDALTGMLCLNFDDSRYHTITENILRLCHPDYFVETNFLVDSDRMAALQRNAAIHGAHSAAGAREAARRKLAERKITPDCLTSADRMDIVAALEENGYFLLKGAVKEVAGVLACSQATVYRYIQQLRDRRTT